MPTGPVDRTISTGAIAALLRQTVSGRAQPGKGSTKPTQGTGTARQTPTGEHAPLASLILQRARELQPDAPDFQARMLRLIVEAALLNEFGHALINAPKFQGMVDQVLSELQTSPQLQRDISAVVNGLGHGQWSG